MLDDGTFTTLLRQATDFKAIPLQTVTKENICN